jgi:APA family basic amino acid/polyamine antiporter
MAGFKRSLTLFDMTMIAIGGSIGSGIFLTPATIARDVGSPWLIVAVWVLGGLITLAGALTFSEAAALLPEAGGQYVYLTRAYGGLVGFLFGWAYFVVVNAGGLGALAVAFAMYLGFFIPLGPSASKTAAIVSLIAERRQRRWRRPGMFSNVFTVLKLLGRGLVAATWRGFQAPPISPCRWPPPAWGAHWRSGWSVPVVGGWQHATYASAEIKNPQRTLPLAMTLGAVAVTAIYLLANLAYMFMLTPAQMAASPRVAADAVSTVLGPVGGSLISLAIVISTFGVIGIYTLTAPRIYYAMAADGVFFRRVAEIHPRYGTPAFAIVFQSLWAAVRVLFWGTFENLISLWSSPTGSSSPGRQRIVLRGRCPALPGLPRAGVPWCRCSSWARRRGSWR